MRIVVTGGAGDLGSRVLAELVHRGHDAVSASRRSGVDLATGHGLAEALDGAAAVVNCADDPRRGDAVTVGGARRLAEAVAASAPPLHLVHISIVGCDANPLRYYQRKAAAESAIAQSGARSTVLRATQFHSLAARFARMLTVGPITVSTGSLAFQPADVDWVAARLADLASGPPPERAVRATDVAGPGVLTVGEIAALVRQRAGRGAPRVLTVPPIGRTMRAFAERSNVPDPSAVETGGRTFAEWLAATPA
ncbi:MAG TPA: hypothetical protein VFJ94_04355 [Intrasporangium sp.]|uniref:SDR family oxidoreductase n=1 Tax=Intrasporangium sp. TaxID=1925024 RepID=UPI002D79C84A|nr:hypothetical protein [Intrasporangium sp.]HET7397737.1 hypothetical protein [Intrasporangium sp.]